MTDPVTLIQDFLRTNWVIITAVVYSSAIFVTWFVRDKDTKIEQFKRDKLGVYKTIRSKIHEGIIQSMSEISLNVYSSLPARDATRVMDSTFKTEIFDQIMEIYSHIRNWRELEKELETIHSSFRDVVKIEDIWNEYSNIGNYVKIAGYCLVVILILYPLYIFFLYCLILIPLILGIFIYCWLILNRVQKEFLVYEGKFYFISGSPE